MSRKKTWDEISDDYYKARTKFVRELRLVRKRTDIYGLVDEIDILFDRLKNIQSGIEIERLSNKPEKPEKPRKAVRRKGP